MIVAGVLAIAEIVLCAMRGELSLNFNVLLIPTGFGLLRRSRGWWKFAIAVLVLLLVAVGIVLAFTLNPGTKIHMSPFWAAVSGGSRGVVVAFLGVVMALVAWALRILTRPDTRALFGPPPSAE
jgi:hypothetical protein